jgi:hypothetical protein
VFKRRYSEILTSTGKQNSRAAGILPPVSASAQRVTSACTASILALAVPVCDGFEQADTLKISSAMPNIEIVLPFALIDVVLCIIRCPRFPSV